MPKKQFTRIQFNPKDQPEQFAEKLNRLQDQLHSLFGQSSFRESIFSNFRLEEDDQQQRTNTSIRNSEFITASFFDDKRRDELQLSFDLNPNFTASVVHSINELSASVTASFLSASNALSFTSASLRQTVFNLSSSVTASFSSFASSITSSFLSSSNALTSTSSSFVATISLFSASAAASFLSASNSITVTSQSINSSIVSASTVINNLRTPQYVVVSNSTELPNERALAVTDPITRTDGGANSSITIGLSAAFSSSLSQLSASLTNTPSGTVMGHSFGDPTGTPRPLSANELGQTIRFGSLTFTSVAPGTYNNYPISSSMNSLFITPNPATGDVEFTGFAVTGSINDGFEFFLMKEGFSGRVILKDNNANSAASNRIFTPGGGPDYVLSSFNDGVRLRWNGTVWHPHAVRRAGVQVNSSGTGSFFPITNHVLSTGLNGTLSIDSSNQRQTITTTIDNNVVATISGSRFTGTVSAAADMFCAGTSHFSGSQRIAGTTTMTKDVFISQTTYLSGTLLAGGGITGSISRINASTPLLTVATSVAAAAAGRSLSIVTGSNGMWTITLN